ncbi:MAG: hypothetical protein KGI47_11275 [Betaproteobacteria bacterium]|nr:hypothetical protein [Betaproteobacteria bacterium]MDE2621633.1 hypothetical protein [Betaproteobacteria bacterium]
MTDSSSLHAPDLEWQALVGKAILRFGDIELISLSCLAHIPTDKIAESAARLEFSRRADILIEILEGRSGITPPLAALLVGFKRAKVLTRTRNLIAHNPVMLDIYVNPHTDDVYTERTIASARSTGLTLNLEQLREFAADVEELSSSLWLNFMQAVNSSDSLFRAYAKK